MLVVANREHLTPWMPWAAGQGLAETRALHRADPQADRRRRRLRDRDRPGRRGSPAWSASTGSTGTHRATSIGYWLDAGEPGPRDDDRGRPRAGRPRVLRLGAQPRRDPARRRRTAAAGRSRSASGSPRRGRCARPSGSATATSTAPSTRCSRRTGTAEARRASARTRGAQPVAVRLQPVVAADDRDLAPRRRLRDAEAVARRPARRAPAPRRRRAPPGATCPSGATSGNARQSTPAAPVAAAVRHATRAPAERPPVTTGSDASGPARSCSSTAIQAASRWCAGAGERRPATR